MGWETDSVTLASCFPPPSCFMFTVFFLLPELGNLLKGVGNLLKGLEDVAGIGVTIMPVNHT